MSSQLPGSRATIAGTPRAARVRFVADPGGAGTVPWVDIDPYESPEVAVPTGKVKWFDAERGFGFIADEAGAEVFLHASALPAGAAAPKPGTRVEFGVADGRRGPQALSVTILEPVPSIAKAHRKPAEDMVVIVEDVIKLLDGVSNDLRRGRYPEKGAATKVASVLRAIADDLEV